MKPAKQIAEFLIEHIKNGESVDFVYQTVMDIHNRGREDAYARVAMLENALREVRKFNIARRDDLPAGLEDCFECGFVDTRANEKHRNSDCPVVTIDAAFETTEAP